MALLIGDNRRVLLKLLRERYSPTLLISVNAAAFGHRRVLKWLQEHSCPLDPHACMFRAAAGGHVEVMEWLECDHNCPLSASPCTPAASPGKTHALRWLRARDCPWTDATCLAVASGGHLEALRWRRERGCPWHENARELVRCSEQTSEHFEVELCKRSVRSCFAPSHARERLGERVLAKLMRARGVQREAGGVAMGMDARLPVGGAVHGFRGGGRTPGSARVRSIRLAQEMSMGISRSLESGARQSPGVVRACVTKHDLVSREERAGRFKLCVHS